LLTLYAPAVPANHPLLRSMAVAIEFPKANQNQRNLSMQVFLRDFVDRIEKQRKIKIAKIIKKVQNRNKTVTLSCHNCSC